MAVYFQDVATEFVPHYFEVIGKDVASVKPMYAENVELKIGSETFKGRDTVAAEVAKLKLQPVTPDAFLAQPGKEPDEIFITVNTGRYVVSFSLANIGENNRFAIKYQLIHKVGA